MNDTINIISDLPHKKRRKESIDGLKNIGSKDINENGIEEHFSTEEHMNEQVGAVNKKMKRDICVEGSGEGVVNFIPNVEDENLLSSSKKKKKKRHSLDTSIDVQTICEDGGGGGNESEKINDVGNELSGNVVPEKGDAEIAAKKKKKRKKQDKEESENDLLGTEVNGFVPMATREKKMKEDTNREGKEDDQVPQGTKDPSTDEGMETRKSTSALGTALKFKSAKVKGDSRTPKVDGSSPSEGFTFIHKVKEARKSKVDRVLPDWLSHPTTVSVNLDDGVPLNSLAGLDPLLRKRLRTNKIKKMFPIQSAVIPELINSSKAISMRYRPRDICVCAPTGSGKTLAYVLPILQALKGRVVPRLRALFLLPTRELAKQVFEVVRKYIMFTTLKVCLATGSHDMKEEQELLVMEDSVGICSADILVATPGRLDDHIENTKGLSFKYLRFLVVDEADLFLSRSGGDMMLKLEQLRKQIHRPAPDNSIICGGFKPKGSLCLPEPYLQQILISATLMHNPEKLQVFDLYRPKLFIASNDSSISTRMEVVAPYLRPQELREEYVVIDSTVKPLVLYHLIHTYKLSRVLVFTKSTKATHTLSIVLSAMSNSYNVAKFSKLEKQRKAILAKFASGKIDILVSSDAMARGIDIKVDQVVLYDVPSVQTYIHRIGRTGRAGRQGFALSLVEDTPESKRSFSAILTSCKDRLTKIYVSDEQLEEYTSLYTNALATLKEKISKEKRNKKAPPKSVKIKKVKYQKMKLKKPNSVKKEI